MGHIVGRYQEDPATVWVEHTDARPAGDSPLVHTIAKLGQIAVTRGHKISPRFHLLSPLGRDDRASAKVSFMTSH